MKSINRIISAILAITIVLTCGCFSAFASNDAATLVLSDYNVRQGDEFSTTISLVENSNIYDFSVKLVYDDELVTLINAEVNPSAGSVVVNTNIVGEIYLNFSSASQNVTRALDIADFTFKVDDNIGIGTYTLLKEDRTFSKSASTLINSTLVDAEIECNLRSFQIFEAGDVDLNSSVEVRDASIIRRYLAELPVEPALTAFNLRIADAEADNEINMRDPSRIQRHVARFTDDIYGDRINIFFFDDNGMRCATKSVVYDGTLSNLPPLSKNSVQGQWSLSATEYIAPNLEQLKKDISLYAIFEDEPEEIGEITYQIFNNNSYIESAYLNGGFENPNPAKYSTQKGLALQELVVDGYDFLGWYATQSGGSPVTEIPAGSTGNKILWARWAPVTYTVQFDSPDVPVDPVTYTVDTGVTLRNADWYGYTFVGWSNDDGFIVNRIKPGTTGNITLHANWTSNRNKATSYNDYGEPIIIEDENNGNFLFVYNIGRIENVPLAQIQYIGNSQRIEINQEYEVSNTVSTESAETIANTISDATTRSSAWTLSKDWNTVYEAGNEYDETNGKTKTRTDSEGNVVGGNYYVSNSKGGASYASTECGGTYTNSSKVTKDASLGLNFSYQKETEVEHAAKIGASYENQSSLSVAVDAITAGIKKTFGLSGEVSGRKKTTETYGSETKIDCAIGTVNENNINTHFDVTENQSSSWNTTSGYEKSYQESRNTEVSDTISELISQKYSYNTSESLGGENSQTESVAGTSTRSDEYSTTLKYSEGNSTSSTQSINYSSDRPGYYRLVNAGTVHVFAVVGYDVATDSYYTYSYNVLDNERHIYLDYSKDNADFDDCENGIVEFKVPYYVNEYVMGVTARSEGLEFDQETGYISDYTGTDDTVTIPQYYSANNGDGTYSAIKVRGINTKAFKGKTNIKSVILPYHVTDIPDNAFEGCTSLQSLISYGLETIGDNAFKNCPSLKTFVLDKYITSLGENAFENVPELIVYASNAEVAENATNSGAKRITVNISTLTDSFDNKIIDIDSSTDYYALISNGETYNNLSIESNAGTTLISNMTLANNTDTPLKFDSSNVLLNRLTVANAPGFALVLTNENTDIGLYGAVSLSSAGGDAMICKNISLAKTNPEIASTLNVSGNVLCCGEVANSNFLSNGSVVYITEDQFTNYLSSKVITFDANDGEVSQNSKIVYYGQEYGTLPIPTRTNYSFDGWYTESSGGTEVTEDTVVSVLTNQTLYAQWTLNSFNVHFDANGGTVSPDSILVLCDQPFGELPEPVRTGFEFAGWYTDATGGTAVTSSTVQTAANDLTVYAHWTALPYTASWTTGIGYSITVSRTASPYANAATGELNSGATVYYGDELSITYEADTGYSLATSGSSSVTVTENVTASTIYATATPNSYTYNIVYQSSNGTALGSSTATYDFGTTNTITPPAKTGYNTPAAQSVTWDSASAKTITFVYTPQSVASTKIIVNNKVYFTDYSGNPLTWYTVKVEYRNRTANKVEVKVSFSSRIVANGWVQMWQRFNAKAGGVNSGDIEVISASTWASASSSERSVTRDTGWLSVPVSATQTSITVSGNTWDSINGSSQNGSETWSSTIPIPTY